jgi:hypothetical protein
MRIPQHRQQPEAHHGPHRSHPTAVRTSGMNEAARSFAKSCLTPRAKVHARQPGLWFRDRSGRRRVSRQDAPCVAPSHETHRRAANLRSVLGGHRKLVLHQGS